MGWRRVWSWRRRRPSSVVEAAGAREVRRAESGEETAGPLEGEEEGLRRHGAAGPGSPGPGCHRPPKPTSGGPGPISEIADRYELQVANVFHAGDGNLHPNIVFDRRDAEETRRVEAASKEIMGVCVEAGGTITGEHGVGADKRKYMPLVFSPRGAGGAPGGQGGVRS